MNICYISDESEHSSLFDKSENSSVTSTTTTSNSSKIITEQNSQFKDSMISDFEDSQELISQENNSKELEFPNSDANRYVKCLNSTLKILIAQLVAYLNSHYTDEGSILHVILLFPYPNFEEEKKNSKL